MKVVFQEIKENEVIARTWECTACGDKIREDMNNRWVKW
jgi:hypothetical protein